MKKKVYLIILIIIAIALTVAGLFLLNEPTTEEKTLPTPSDYSLTTLYKTTTCYTKDCEAKSEDSYLKISYNYDSKILQDAITKLNKETEAYYNQVITSTVDNQTCLNTFNNHSLRIYNTYDSYTTDEIISISIQRTKINLCTNETEPFQVTAYLYDIKEDKMLTTKEVMTKLNISDEDIKNAIMATNATLSQLENLTIETNDTYEDLVIYYGTDKKLYVSYFIPEMNSYFSANIG